MHYTCTMNKIYATEYVVHYGDNMVQLKIEILSVFYHITQIVFSAIHNYEYVINRLVALRIIWRNFQIIELASKIIILIILGQLSQETYFSQQFTAFCSIFTFAFQ